jgi:hypothetical protein
MNCRDFERVMNERFDARENLSGAWDRDIQRHAETCSACQASVARYQRLEQALHTLAPIPAPSAGLADRIIAARHAEVIGGPRTISLRPWLRAMAAAASLLIGVFLIGRFTNHGTQPAPPSTAVSSAHSPAPIDPQALNDALARAGSATWDLAQAASAPATKFGREMFDSATITEGPEGDETLPLSLPVSSASKMWQSVEDRVNAGVRPLSGSARHAFGFLFAAPSGDS